MRFFGVWINVPLPPSLLSPLDFEREKRTGKWYSYEVQHCAVFEKNAWCIIFEGFPEAVFGEGKTGEQIMKILKAMKESNESKGSSNSFYE